MAAPTAPNVTSLTTEGLKKAGDSSPSSALLSRAQTEWMEEIKNDLWDKCKALKSIQKTKAMILNKGQSQYSMPTDYAGQGEISMRLLDGGHRSTLQSAGASTATLNSSETADEGFIIGKELLITSGTGINEIAQMLSYTQATKVVGSVNPAWATTPVAGDGYMIVEHYYPVEQGPVWDFDRLPHPNVRNRPSRFHPVGDQDYQEFVLDSPPDKLYGALLRYPVNIMTLDLSSTLLATLYQKYRNLWILGVKYRRLDDRDDDRAPAARQEYIAKLFDVVAHETYGIDLHDLQQRCVE